MKLSIFALSAGVLSQVYGAIIPEANLAVGGKSSESNGLEKRDTFKCYPPGERTATSASLERIAQYWESRGDERKSYSFATQMNPTEFNHDVSGGFSRVEVYPHKNGQRFDHEVSASGRHIAIGIRDIIRHCTNDNCPGKSYCGTGGEGVAYGNGDFVIKTSGGGNW